MSRVLLGSCMLLATACGPPPGPPLDPTPPVEPPQGCIEVEPRALSFDATDLDVGVVPEVARVTISNPCEGRLELYRVDLSPRAVAESFRVENLFEVLIEEGDETGFDVSFRPQEPGMVQGRISIESTDPDPSGVRVELTGRASPRQVEVEPDTHDFGGVALDCVERVSFEVVNLGDTPIEVVDVQLESASFTLDSPVTGTVPPHQDGGEPFRVDVVVEPQLVGALSAAVIVQTDVPLEPQHVIEVFAEGLLAGPCR